MGVALVCLLLTALVTLPFFVIGEVPQRGCCGGTMPVTHDGAMHDNQMRSFWRGLTSGRLFPRWDDQTHRGYGGPTMAFYPPGIYYLTSLLYWPLRDWHSVQITLSLMLMGASGGALYLYAREVMSRGASLISMAIFIAAPYHLLNQYQRGAISEQLSFIWMPLALLFAERLLKGTREKVLLWRTAGVNGDGRRTWLSFAGLAAIFGAFVFSHPPTAYQFLLVFGPGFSIWGLRRSAGRGMVAIALALLFGSLLAAVYFYPAIAEQRFINADDVEKVWPYHSSYVFDFNQRVYDHLKNDFTIRLDRIWAFSTGVIVLLGVTLLTVRGSLKSLELRTRVWLWFGAGLLSAFLMTKPSELAGRFIPKIEIGVFSWRMLSIASLVAALLAGAAWQAAVDLANESRRSLKTVLKTVPGLVLIATVMMSLSYVIEPMYRAEAFKPIPEHYNFATLPRGVPHDVPKMELAQLASGTGRVTVERWEPEFRVLSVELDKPDQLQLRTSNFPGWTAFANGRAAEIKSGDVGQIVIDLPSGRSQVTLEFRSTPIRRASAWITLISFAVLTSMVVILKRRS